MERKNPGLKPWAKLWSPFGRKNVWFAWVGREPGTEQPAIRSGPIRRPERSPLEPLSSGRRLDGRDRIRAAHCLEPERVAHGYQQKCQPEHGLSVDLLVRCSDRIGLNRSLDWFVLVSSSYRFSATASDRTAPSGMNCSTSIPSALATPMP